LVITMIISSHRWFIYSWSQTVILAHYQI